MVGHLLVQCIQNCVPQKLIGGILIIGKEFHVRVHLEMVHALFPSRDSQGTAVEAQYLKLI